MSAGLPNFKPLNPWGRPMPKVDRKATPVMEALYQVTVETRSGTLKIGPKAGKLFCEQLASDIVTQIAKGNERDWSNPTVAIALS